MNEEDRKIFAKNLKHYMKRDDVNGVALAKYMGVTSATVSDWTKAKKMPRVDKIKSLANYFRIKMSDLTEDKDHYVEVPEILLRYNELDIEYKDELMKRAEELKRLQEYAKRLKKGARNVGTDKK